MRRQALSTCMQANHVPFHYVLYNMSYYIRLALYSIVCLCQLYVYTGNIIYTILEIWETFLLPYAIIYQAINILQNYIVYKL